MEFGVPFWVQVMFGVPAYAILSWGIYKWFRERRSSPRRSSAPSYRSPHESWAMAFEEQRRRYAALVEENALLRSNVYARMGAILLAILIFSVLSLSVASAIMAPTDEERPGPTRDYPIDAGYMTWGDGRTSLSTTYGRTMTFTVILLDRSAPLRPYCLEQRPLWFADPAAYIPGPNRLRYILR